jgi:biotin carboxyl carrier protein
MPVYSVVIGERTLRVSVRRDGDAVFVRVDDGEEMVADFRQLHGALYALTLGAERLEVAASSSAGQALVVLNGLEYAAEVMDEAHARLASVAGGRGGGHGRVELKAPMPGLLVRVLCAVGDEVQAGQPLAVLQAMKMENELALARGGRVARINVEAGQTVEQNQVLVALE